MVLTHTHKGKDYVFIKPSSNSNVILAKLKSKKLRSGWVVLDELPAGREPKVNSRGLLYVS